MNKVILGVILFVTLLNAKKYLNKIKIWRWMRTLKIQQHLTAFNNLTKDTNGFFLSKKAREKSDALEYIYGEIEFIPFIALLSLCHPNKNTIFYDLGSGTGKAVFACSMVFNVKKSVGVEIFKNLYFAAITQQQMLLKEVCYTNNARNISFINDDFINLNFPDATIIFINATGFFGDVWATISNKLDILTEKVTIITTSKKLLAKSFQVEKETKVTMSWGVVTAYIHKKIPGYKFSS